MKGIQTHEYAFVLNYQTHSLLMQSCPLHFSILFDLMKFEMFYKNNVVIAYTSQVLTLFAGALLEKQIVLVCCNLVFS